MMRSTFLLRSPRLFFVLLVGLLLGSILLALNVGGNTRFRLANFGRQ